MDKLPHGTRPGVIAAYIALAGALTLSLPALVVAQASDELNGIVPMTVGDLSRDPLSPLDAVCQPTGRCYLSLSYYDHAGARRGYVVVNWTRDAAAGVGQFSAPRLPLNRQGWTSIENDERQVQCKISLFGKDDPIAEAFLVTAAEQISAGLASHARAWGPSRDSDRIGWLTATDGWVRVDEYADSPSSSGVTPNRGYPILGGDRIRTDPGAGAEIRLEFPLAPNANSNKYLRLGENTTVNLQYSNHPYEFKVNVEHGWASLEGDWEGFQRLPGVDIVAGRGSVRAIDGEVLVYMDRDVGIASFYLNGHASTYYEANEFGARRLIPLDAGDQLNVGTRGLGTRLPMQPGQYGALRARHIRVSSSMIMNPEWAPDVLGKLTVSEGTVIGVRKDGRTYHLLVGSNLLADATLETRSDGRAQIMIGGANMTFGTDVFSIGESTSVILHRAGIEFYDGIIFKRPASKPSTPGVRVVSAGVIKAVIRGTEFVTAFDRESGEVTFHLREGVLEIRSDANSQVVPLRSGQSLVANQDGEMAAPTKLSERVFDDLVASIEPRGATSPFSTNQANGGLPAGTEVTAVLFYESGIDQPPQAERVYRDRFTRSARYINFELRLRFPVVRERRPFAIDAVITKNGVPFARFTTNTALEPGWVDSYHSSSWGSPEGDSWAPGEYELMLSINSGPLAQSEFTVDSNEVIK